MVRFLSRLPLRQLLTVPYIALMAVLALAIGGLSYQAGRDAVDALSDRLLTETVNRITLALERHVAGSAAVLETAFPQGVAAPDSVQPALPELRTRFWLATSIHRDPNNYVYYGNSNGEFVGLWRKSATEAELRLRTDARLPRTIYDFTGIAGPLRDPVVEPKMYDPRVRPWYVTAASNRDDIWTSVYIDFKTTELVATRAKRVVDGAGKFAGVVATDMSLRQVDDFLRRLALTRNGLAFVFEPDGNLIGTSRGPHMRTGADGRSERLNAAASSDPILLATYHEIRELIGQSNAAVPVNTRVFQAPDGHSVQVAYARIQDNAGLDWFVAVAVPRTDFMQGVIDNFWRTLALAGICVLGTVGIGLLVLAVVARELKLLAEAARLMGEGDLRVPVQVSRADELGALAKGFAAMQQRLATDRITGLASREAALRRLEERVTQQRRRGDSMPFAILFVDLNKFKQVNDTFGHDVGDLMLREISERMKSSLRANDIVARFGGDEFLVILDEVGSRAEAERVRAHLEQALSQPLACFPGNAGAAIGVALCPDDALDAESLIKRADADMYRRKDAPPPPA